MKLARILLASAAVALLAACSSDPVGPSSGASDRLKPRHGIIADSTTLNTDGVTGDGTLGEMDQPPTCYDTTVVVSGVTTIVRVCSDGRGGFLGSGG